MAIHQIMYALPSMLKTKSKFLTSTSLVLFVLVGVSNSIPIDQPNTSEQNVEAEAAPIGYIPSELLARYYGNLYNDQEQENVAKRAPQPDQVEEELFPRYVQRRSGTNGYWNLLKALEEELALEGMSKQGIEDDGATVNEVAPAGDDMHKVNKRRKFSYVYTTNQKRCIMCRRYGFWVTAINKMGSNNLKGFLGKHRNIYNIYKRGAPGVKWLPRPLLTSSQ